MEGRCVLEQIQIKNIRSLKDTGPIKLCPLNVLVGNNSSGKSTFLRTFPLIKQSISKYTNGPILWAGDIDDYVDFGSFKETVTDGNEANSIELTFVLEPQQLATLFSPFYYSFPIKSNFVESTENEISYTIVIHSKGTGYNVGEYVSSTRIVIYNHTLHIEYSPEGKISTILLDGTPFPLPPADEEIRYGYYFSRSLFHSSTTIFGSKIPQCDTVVDELRSIMEGWFIPKTGKQRPPRSDSRFLNIIHIVGDLICRGANATELSSYFTKLYDTEDSDVSSLQKDIVTIEQRLRGYNDTKLQSIVKSFLFVNCCAYLPDIDKYLSEYFKHVHYIAPVRATAERYYRWRNTAIDDIDHQGKNLAIFLNSLTPGKREAFQEWTLLHFGFKILVQREVGHLSVNVKLNGIEGTFNLSDTGFGYSQILPIITQLWMLSTKEKNTRASTPLIVAIEQPELHLHPNLQAKLAKVFIASIKLAEEHGYQLQLILETHSETIVNYFGTAIARGDLSPDDISVILFDKCFGCKHTDVRISSYDSLGFLTGWPIGFLSAGE